MKVIIAGSRTITDEASIFCNFDSVYFDQIDEIVAGGASGVDSFGPRIAEMRQARFTLFPADWIKYGKAAGFLRNKQMADYADALIAIWDGKSKGTRHMINLMLDAGKHTHVFVVK